MAPRTVYANLADGEAFLSLWDQSLADMGSLGAIPCTASGTNAIVLTPIASSFPPNINNPPNPNQLFSFVATATSTGAVTVSISGVTSFLKLYRMDAATQAASGDVQNTVTYVISFNSALNSAIGGFQIQSPVNNEINPVITGATISNSTITTSTYNGNTWTAGSGTLTIAALKTLTSSNTLTFAGTDGSTLNIGTGGTLGSNAFTSTAYAPIASPTFTGTQTLTTALTTTLNGNTFTTGSYTLTGTAGKTLNFTNSLTLSGTDSTTMTFPGTSATIARTDAGNTFTGTQNLVSLTASSAVATDGSKNLVSVTNTGSGNNVLATTPTISQANLVGTTTNDNAAAGSVGELISATVAQGSAVSLTTVTAANVTSISLTAGDWDVCASTGFSGGATTTVAFLEGSISTTTGSVNETIGNFGVYNPGFTNATPFNFGHTSATEVCLNINPVRISLASTTTVFLVAFASFATSSCSAFGTIRARRIR